MPARPRAGTLVIQTAFLGDVVLTTPLLAALAARHGPVDVLVTPAAAPLLEALPAVHEVLVYDKRGRDRGLGALLRLGRTLRRRRYARVVLPHRSVRSAALGLLSGAPHRIGFAGAPGTWGYTGRVTRAATGHEVERLLALAGDVPASPVAVGLTAAHRAEAATWLDARGVPDGFVALAPGSVWATKRWPGYAELAARLDRGVVVLGGRDDREAAERIAAAAPERVAVAAGALSLPGSAALLERAAVLVTNDSAPLHLATAVGTPVVAIFGPTAPAFGFGPRGAGDEVVEHPGLACRPCSRHGPMRCPLGHHRCMQEVDVARVLAAVQRVIEGRNAPCAT